MPESDWVPPADLPDKLHGVIGIDVETCDRGLQDKKGSGWPWTDGGHAVGYSVRADNFSGYLPVAHLAGGNMDANKVRAWLRSVLSDPGQVKVGANVMYDLGWLGRDGIEVKGPVCDVLLTEALLDEHRRSYSLDAVARDRVGRGKEEGLLERAAAALGLDPKKDLWRVHSRYVGPYATEDAVLAREILQKQMLHIEEDDLAEIFKLEHDLLPMYVDMRARGVRVDVPYAEALRTKWMREAAEMVAEISRMAGFPVNIWSADSVARLFDQEGIWYGRTTTGKPSVTKELLERTNHRAAKMIRAAREKEKLIGTFLESQVLGQCHDGRVHGEIWPLKSDDGGTVSGRLAMSNPNLQFIPARTEEGQEIRRCFLPEEGQEWASCDFSQQEPRLTVHFAVKAKVQGAEEAQRRYREDPGMSYHDFAAELTGLPYKSAKILNLAIIYGRGVENTSQELGISQEECKEMFARHHQEMPFARALSEHCQARVQRRNYIRTLLGRRQRFELMEPARWEARDGSAYPEAKAREVWPNQRLVPARMHKALNALIQGSAADQTKAAMLNLWKSGLRHSIMIQVHDELCCSVNNLEEAEMIAHYMKEAAPLCVPTKVDVKVGPNWRDAK